MFRPIAQTPISTRTYLAPLRRSAAEIQFWGYETGNVLAAMAGAGGISALWAALDDEARRGGARALIETHGDVALTFGIAGIMLWMTAAQWVGKRLAPGQALRGVDLVAAVTAAVLIVLALSYGVTALTVSAAFFVTGSALLRQSDRWPRLLKSGGLLLSAGGGALFVAGVTGPTSALSLFTALTGTAVIMAGLLTYQGGIFVCRAAGATQTAFGRKVDQVILRSIETVVLPALFWIPATTKAQYPFLTSMWARLPFRLLSAVAGLATFTASGALFAGACVLWALGDAAIGAMDAEEI